MQGGDQNMNYAPMQVDYNNNPASYQQGMDYMQPNAGAPVGPPNDGMQPVMMRNQMGANNSSMNGYQMPYNQGIFYFYWLI